MMNAQNQIKTGMVAFGTAGAAGGKDLGIAGRVGLIGQNLDQ